MSIGYGSACIHACAACSVAVRNFSFSNSIGYEFSLSAVLIHGQSGPDTEPLISFVMSLTAFLRLGIKLNAVCLNHQTLYKVFSLRTYAVLIITIVPDLCDSNIGSVCIPGVGYGVTVSGISFASVSSVACVQQFTGEFLPHGVYDLCSAIPEHLQITKCLLKRPCIRSCIVSIIPCVKHCRLAGVCAVSKQTEDNLTGTHARFVGIIIPFLAHRYTCGIRCPAVCHDELRILHSQISGLYIVNRFIYICIAYGYLSIYAVKLLSDLVNSRLAMLSGLVNLKISNNFRPSVFRLQNYIFLCKCIIIT